MRSAEDIASECAVPVWAVRKIQAEALRFAANLSGELHRRYVLELADKLDPPPVKSCPTCSNR